MPHVMPQEICSGVDCRFLNFICFFWRQCFMFFNNNVLLNDLKYMIQNMIHQVIQILHSILELIFIFIVFV